MVRDFIVSLYGENTYAVLAFIFNFYYIWLPFVLGFIFWELWMRYIRYLTFTTAPTVLLEIRLPPEVTKSPLSMELFLTSLHYTSGESTFFDRYWMGKTRPWFSLEIVSLG